MKLAVLSGKGGAGKTFFATSLAYVANEETKTRYVDCDVEAPNGYLFLHSGNKVTVPNSESEADLKVTVPYLGPEENPKVTVPQPAKGSEVTVPMTFEKTKVTVPVPRVDQDLCVACGACRDFCAFNALVMIKNQVKVYDELCHHCKGCSLVCPSQAIELVNHVVGEKARGKDGPVELVMGLMNIGEPSGNAIIHDMLSEEFEGHQVIDCPPGSACNVMESIDEADYCLIVAEPTIFGRHNMKMVIDLCKTLSKPFGVVFNKVTDNLDQEIRALEEASVICYGGLEDRRDIAKALSQGELPVKSITAVHEFFDTLWLALKEARLG